MKKFLNWLKGLFRKPMTGEDKPKPEVKPIDPAEVQANREAFYTIYCELFKDGSLREIYTGKKLSVYAVAEKNYAVVLFTDRLPEEHFLFLNINEVEARHVVADEEFFLKILENRKSIGRVAILNAKSKLALQRINAERLATGTWEVTPEMDAEVLGGKAPAVQEK